MRTIPITEQPPEKLPKRIEQLILQGENEVLDFKKEVTSEIKIAKTIVSFANHKGGRLLIGVNDNKSIHGINAEEELFMLEKAAGFYCRPKIELEIYPWHSGKKTILEVIIPQGTDKPYYSLGDDGKWWVYIRVMDQSLLASKVVVDVLKRGQTGTMVSFTS
ncbi:MAG TPA: ATP-binding protein, partial [Bacteroidia bacterium]|nr:ATP-binding protein [Bacteroidia bacterium]